MAPLEVIATLDKVVSCPPFCRARARLGQRDDALRLIRPYEARFPNTAVPRQCFALFYALLGDEANTVNWLERSAERREMQVLNVAVNPVFRSMHARAQRDDPVIGRPSGQLADPGQVEQAGRPHPVEVDVDHHVSSPGDRQHARMSSLDGKHIRPGRGPCEMARRTPGPSHSRVLKRCRPAWTSPGLGQQMPDKSRPRR